MPTDTGSHAAWIRTHQLCRNYDLAEHVIRAVDNVDLGIDRGEYLAVVGASGSGKSTLLGLLAGLDTPTSGHIVVDDLRLDELSARELAGYRARKVGVVFQSFNLLPHHSALRNVEMALYFDDTPRRLRRQRAIDALERLGLGDRLEHRPLDLSGGEQQRVAVARALVKQPDVLFADEPTGNLDQDNARAIAAILSELNGTGMTIVLVTHDLEMARGEASRVVHMHYGRVQEPAAEERRP